MQLIKSTALLLVLLCNVSAYSATIISSGGVDGSGGFPAILSSAGETYQLSENISCDTTCFKIAASNIVLDLNGKTSTFGALPSPNLQDPGFESWSDSSTPSSWTIIDGTATRTSAQVYGNYDCQLSETASIKSGNVTLAANQTYIYYAAIFGSSSDNYDISVKDASDDSTIATTNVTGGDLARAFAVNNGVIDCTENEYKPSSEKTVYLQIDCNGTASTKLVHYADIRPIKSYFVINHSYAKASLAPDLGNTGWQSSTNLTVKNGTISQGAAGHVKSAAVYMASLPSGLYQNLTINMVGNNTAGITIVEATNLVIDRAIITTSNFLNLNRMHPPASIDLIQPSRGAYATEVKNCTISNDPEYSVRVAGFGYLSDDAQTLKIHNNNLKGKAYNTEPYAIALYGVINVDIYYNTISPNQDRGGRGILLDSVANRSGYLDGTENVRVYGNYFENIKEKFNTEYNRTSLESVAIRIRNWGGDDPVEQHKNLKIYNNKMVVGTNDDYSHASYGVNATLSGASDDIEIYDNVIEATYSGTGANDWVSGISLQNAGHTSGSYLVHHNTITSNKYGIGISGNDGSDATKFRFYSNNIQATESPIRIGMLSYTGTVSDIDFYCNILDNDGASGYPIYLNGTLSDLYFSHNSITNSNASGYEVWVDANESADCIFCDNGTIDVTGGGSVGSANTPCQDGSTGCYEGAGSRYSGPYGHLAGLASLSIGAGANTITTGAGSGTIMVSP